ncbi:MAG TPA: hypothetical protein PKD67_07270 [Ignavibacteriaceae bacterium]|nr:hypothetical protein [Ignavibacteriaceae bacterium]
MKVFRLSILLLTIFALSMIDFTLAQGTRVTDRGTYLARKIGIHRGNQVRTIFNNYGVIAQPGNQGPRGAWKFDANGYVGDVSPLVGVKLPVKDYNNDGIKDTVVEVVITPVDRPGGGNSNGLGNSFGGFDPIPGFASPTLNKPGEGVAMSHLPETWPNRWPDQPNWIYSGSMDASYLPQVDWNGYFGRGQFNADQESYYWMDDNEDAKLYKLYGFQPDSTDPNRYGQALQVNVRGLQWSNFLAQNVVFWLYNITNDGTTPYDQAVFGTLVGTYVGAAGDEYNDDASFFDVRQSITYTWDIEPGRGYEYIRPSANPQWQPNPFAVGYIAYAFLESPGNAYDGVDNDGDDSKHGGTAPFFAAIDFQAKTVKPGDKLVLIDKNNFKRTVVTMPNDTITVYSMGVPFFLRPNQTTLIEGNLDPITGLVNKNAYDGIDNNLNGIIDENYTLHYRQYKKSPQNVVLIDTLNPIQYKNYFTGQGVNDKMIDEARNDGIDNNNNWSVITDDVGLDGKAGTGDFGEGDGKPTSAWQKPGVVPGITDTTVNNYGLVDTRSPGEPNIDKTDIEESDQIGLTSFQYFVPAGAITMADQRDMWKRMNPGYFDVPKSVVNNTATQGEDGDFIFASGYFPLLPGGTERFSLALAFGDNLPGVIKTKQIAQVIYNANYNFPRPPEKPTLTVVPGDGQVTLYWNRVAETTIDKTTREVEFEGYKLYRGTDPDLTDALEISDGTGAKVFYKPIFQCDLRDGITGYFNSSPTLYALTNGAPYYLGDDSGIQNFYVDKGLTNGRTYYYALVAYTRGRSNLDIFPTENTRFISKDASGNVSTDINTAAVIPNAPVLGYVPPKSGVQLARTSGISTKIPYYEIVDPTRVTDSTYTVTFNDTLKNGVKFAYSYNIQNAGSGKYLLKNSKLLPDNGVVVDGYRLSFDTTYQAYNSIALDTSSSGWNKRSKLNLTPIASVVNNSIAKLFGKRLPNTYKFVFSDSYTDTSNNLIAATGPLYAFAKKVTNFKIYNVTNPAKPYRIQYGFTESTQKRRDTLSTLDQVFLSDSTGSSLSWVVLFTGSDTSNVPKGGDTLTISFYKPFTSADKFSFTTSMPSVDENIVKADLNRIKVVPNPYVVTSIYEQPLPPNVRGRGERVVYFTHLPPNCTIRIFTSAGDEVQTLVQNGNINDGTVTWDLRSKEGLDIAYGVYFYVVEIPGSSETKIGKLAVIK